MRTKKCSPVVRAGRLAKAIGFHENAGAVELLAENEAGREAAVSLYVLAGIAAADVICCARLGVHAQGENHHEATDLLSQVDVGLARDLGTLLRMKSASGYGATMSSPDDLKKARRSADRLVSEARAVQL